VRRLAVALLALSLGVGRRPLALSAGAAFVDASRARAEASLPDVASARRLGYRVDSVAGTIEHWVADRYVEDGRTLDPARPEGLVYRVDGDRRTLMAVFFFVAEGVPVPDVRYDGWHSHPTCFGPGGIGIPVPGGPCPPGTARRVGPTMLHVWLDGSGWSPFEATVAPAYVCRVPASAA
jgi:hypothetical protein